MTDSGASFPGRRPFVAFSTTVRAIPSAAPAAAPQVQHPAGQPAAAPASASGGATLAARSQR